MVVTAALALALPGAAQARGHLDLSVDPGDPQCNPEFTVPGECKFQFEMTAKIRQPKRCRRLPDERTVKISRLDPPFSEKLWNEFSMPGRRFTETIELDALAPGHEPVPGDALNFTALDEAIGGTKMLFKARAQKVHGLDPFQGPFVCKKLKQPGVTEVTVPTPPPE